MTVWLVDDAREKDSLPEGTLALVRHFCFEQDTVRAVCADIEARYPGDPYVVHKGTDGRGNPLMDHASFDFGGMAMKDEHFHELRIEGLRVSFPARQYTGLKDVLQKALQAQNYPGFLKLRRFPGCIICLSRSRAQAFWKALEDGVDTFQKQERFEDERFLKTLQSVQKKTQGLDPGILARQKSAMVGKKRLKR